MVDYYACMSARKLAVVESKPEITEITVYSIVARPFKYDTFRMEKIAQHIFESSYEEAIQCLQWHGLVWFRDDDAEDLVDAAARMFCAEVV